MAVRRKKDAGWSPRLAGLVLCAFFILGMITGFSTTGRQIVLRAAGVLSSLERRFDISWRPAHGAIESLGSDIDVLRSHFIISRHARRTRNRTPDAEPIAIVERRDGFYALFTDGALSGPVSPISQGDLPILSGSGLESVPGDELVADAALLVRSEAQLSRIVSEMSIADDGVASLYLEGARTEIRLDLDRSQFELDRANQVLARWQGRERSIAQLDMTTPGLAVLRMRAAPAAAGKNPTPKASRQTIAANGMVRGRSMTR